MMNGRHLPAGQGMPPDIGRRRGPYNQHQNYQYSQAQHHQQHMYSNYMPQQPYGASYYPQPIPPQFHNAPLPQQQYAYPAPPYIRSPPPQSIPQYAPSPSISQHSQSFSQPQASPVVSSDYRRSPQAPSSSHSSYTVPAQTTPSTPPSSVAPQPVQHIEPVQAIPLSFTPEIETVEIPFRAPLPWLSRPEETWPARKPRRKRKAPQQVLGEPVELPNKSQGPDNGAGAEDELEKASESVLDQSQKEDAVATESTSLESAARPETPTTSQPASEDVHSTAPTTPSSSIQTPLAVPGDTTPVANIPAKRATKPAVPIIPALPKTISKDASRKDSGKSVEEQAVQIEPSSTPETTVAKAVESVQAEPATEETKPAAPAAPAWSKPKAWSGLFNPGTAKSAASNEGPVTNAAPGFAKSTSESLGDALRSFDPVSNDSKICFIEPRGLVNTGNMCYMNSVLQVLIFCSPFYSFLDQVSKRAAHSFKSETPLIDAMILFMREYPIIDSAANVEQLRLRLKEGELEKYGEQFTPDFVYNVINRLPRFSSMRHGHQQDAEEFLGFLLEGLHDECVQVMHNGSSAVPSATATPQNPSSPISEHGSVQGSVSGQENGWLEVGPKQKAAITRSSGTIITKSPVTKIFGGKLRSELRVPGLKDSVTLEPFQHLQLDIGASNVNNIVDALRGLTRSEALQGDFKSPKGPNVTANKQVFIETLPPVLIIHLKRFQYDNAGGTQKIWKKVGYPLELEIPKEVFSRQKRGVYAHSGLPKYRLIAVVYHHGKNASGGHYTVDVRRQDGKEWIRLDDTIIRRVKSEEVAEAGSEEDPKVLAAALEAHKKDTMASGNGFAAIDGVEDEDEGEEGGWKKATGSSGKKWSSVVNGATTPKPKTDKFSVKDNKVAYLLFYQKI